MNLETERLTIRPFVRDDLPTLIGLRSDDDVIRYLGGREMQNPEAIAKRFEFYLACEEKFGFSMSAMIWRETGAMIGWCGLQPLDGTDEIEVGYGMIKEYWGRGIGFEAAKALLGYGFGTAGLERIVAVAYPENEGSWRIMEKCGMKFEKRAVHYGAECVFYAVSKSGFEVSSRP